MVVKKEEFGVTSKEDERLKKRNFGGGLMSRRNDFWS